MSYPRVTIHLGQPKTGTSSIQAACAANRAILADRWKILYPSLAEDFLFPDPPHQSFIFERSEGGFRSSQEVCDFFGEAFDYSASREIHHIVVSWEAFFEVDWMDLLAESFARMGVSPDFLVYLRRQDAWLESAWKQWHNKMPGDPSASEYALNAASDWYYVLDLWSQRFPKQSFRVRPYEKQQLQGGLIADFFFSLGYDEALASELAPAPETNVSQNSGFSPDVVSMLTLLRELNSDLHDVRIFDLFGDLLGEQFKKREFESYHLLSPADRIQILQKNEASNQRIAREYLGRPDGRLFLEPWPDPAETWHPPEALTLERALPILISMQLTFRERLLAQYDAFQKLHERSVAQESTLQTLHEQFAAQTTILQELQERDRPGSHARRSRVETETSETGQ